MVLSPIGKIVYEEWFASSDIRKEICLDHEDFIIMSNHIHGIIQIVGTENIGAHGMRENIGAGQSPLHKNQHPCGPVPKSLSSFIVGFKTAVTKRVHALNETISGSVWQRNFYEHIVRDEHEWARIRAYIETNLIHWAKDEENPEYQK